MARKIMLQADLDAAEAKGELDSLSGDLDRFGKKEAEAKIKVAADQAKAAIVEVRAELEAIPKEQTIRIRVEAEQAKLAALEARMAKLNSISSSGVTDSQGAALAQRMGVVANQIEATRTRIESLGGDLDRLGSDGERSFSKISSGLTNMRTGLADALGHIPLLGGLIKGAINGVGDGLSKLTTLLPEAAQGFGGVVTAGLSLAAVGPIVLVIVAALSALIISLGQALIGIAALGVAFLAALAPIALIVGAVALKLKDAYQAQQQLKQATDAQRQAVISLQQAQQNESQQRLAALEAEKQATLSLRQANDSLADAKLGQQSAAEQLVSAQLAEQQFLQTLSGFGMSPADLTKRASNVDVSGNAGQTQQGSSRTAMATLVNQWNILKTATAQARQNVTDTATQTAVAADAAAKAKTAFEQFQSKGLKGYAPYTSSIAATAKAVISLAGANRTLNLDTKKMASTDGVLGILDRLKKTLGAILSPALSAAFKGLGQGLEILGKGLKPLEPSLTVLGRAVGAAFVQLAKALTSKQGLSELKQLITESAQLLPTMVQFFIGLGGLLTGVANAAIPRLKNGLGGLADKFIDVAKHPKQIAEFINKCIDQTKVWFHVVGTLVSAFNKLAGALGPVLSFVSKIVDAISSVGSAFGEAVYGGATGNSLQALATNQQANQTIAAMEASLKSGIQQFGQHRGRALTAAAEANLIQALAGFGVNYTGPIATPGTQNVTNHFNGSSADPHHASAVIARRLRAQGNGVH